MADETDYEHESAPSTDGTYTEHTQNIGDNEKLILWLNGVTQDEDTQQGPYSSQWDIPSEAIPYMGFSPMLKEATEKALCESGITGEKDQCVWIGRPEQKRKYCGFDHHRGPKKTWVTSCTCRIDIYIPQNMYRLPYYIVICRGNHSHYPPLPNRVPAELAQDVGQVIQDYGE
ncbi:uncharacterized protein BCR38DRAFT_514523 [Pseudomassariella vexata]|uniref:Uncharacterized protein n=1 Tax=Pseudomassariella vexata TaxID=1141098 RepID=A0A1Y2DXA1_9PEZI|nr:uncharacterized protein BCR38DRAFT_514523 [Pseudomassariella vexata]ORY63893.1 hypothetical protein BCR38DRAFT_514523 [Pseudomassariella vexata]